MIKYVCTSLALKAFSLSPGMRKIYRGLGNTAGADKRLKGMPQYYLDRVNRTLGLHDEIGTPADGQRMLELGTGWLHWEALTARLFYDVGAVLYDVWDNRQLEAMKHHLGQLEGRLDELKVDEAQRERARKLIGKVMEVDSFEALYALLDFEYHLDADGRLEKVESGEFDFVVSGGVMEHIYAKDAEAVVQGIARILKPGGYSVQSINIRDHLYGYDTSVSAKQYLAYSDATWRRWFENDVQYINRIQRSEWLGMFERAGMELVREHIDEVRLEGLKVDARFASFDEKDLKCGGLLIVHRKP